MRGLRGSVGLVTVVGAVAWFGAEAVSGQGAPRANEAQAQTPYTVPRTPDGHPDLQGNWTNATLTTFERQRGLGPVYTQAEVDEVEGRARSTVQAGSDPSDRGV